MRLSKKIRKRSNTNGEIKKKKRKIYEEAAVLWWRGHVWRGENWGLDEIHIYIQPRQGFIFPHLGASPLW